MHARTHSSLIGAVLIATCLLVSSCATVKQSVTIVPVSSQYAISASSSHRVDGRTISESEMATVKTFHFEKFYSAKMSEKEIRLDLSTDLAKLLEEAGANGAIRLRLKVTDVDTSTVGGVAAERYLGAVVALGGLTVASLPYSLSGYTASQASIPPEWLAYGIGITVVGAAMFGGSWLHESLGTIGYTFEIDGTAVRYPS